VYPGRLLSITALLGERSRFPHLHCELPVDKSELWSVFWLGATHF